MKSYFLLSLLTIICIWMSCSKPKTEPGKNNKNQDSLFCGTPTYPQYKCDTILCTMDFVSINLTVLDKKNNPVMLDSFYTENNKGKMPSFLYSHNSFDNTYTVFNDGWVTNHQQTYEYVRFKGYKNGLKLVDESFAIYTSCCHIGKISGADTVIVP